MKLHLATAAAIGALMLGPALAAQDEDSSPGAASETIEDVHKLDATEGMTKEVPEMKPDEQAAADEAEEGARQAATDQPTTDPGSEALEDVHKLDATKGMSEQVPPMTPEDEQRTGEAEEPLGADDATAGAEADLGAEADIDAQAELDREVDAEAQAGADAGAQAEWDTPWDADAE